MQPRLDRFVSRMFNFSLLLLFVLFPAAGYPAAQADMAGTPDTPTTLAPEDVIDYWVASPTVFLHTGLYCDSILPGAKPQNNPDSSDGSRDEIVSRISAYGGAIHQLFESKVSGPDCPPLRVRSNIVADTQYVYWVGDTGLLRLSVDASVGDAPALVNSTLLPKVRSVELVDAGDRIFAIIDDAIALSSDIVSIDKVAGKMEKVDSSINYAFDLSWDGEYLYYMSLSAPGFSLRRIKPATGLAEWISTNVDSYYAEGLRSVSSIDSPVVLYSHYVYISKSNQIYRFNNLTGKTEGPIYTSSNADVYIKSMTSDQHRLFFFEQSYDCPSFDTCSVLRSMPRSGGAAVLRCTCDGIKLTTNHTFLFWNEISYDSIGLKYGGLYRLPNNGVPPIEVKKPFLHGDYLRAVGNLRTSTVKTSLSDVSRLSDTPALSVPQQQGGYMLQLLDGQGTVLSNHIFSPTLTSPDDPQRLNFGLVVEFAPGTAQMQILRAADAAVLTSQSISPNPPLINNVVLSDTINLSGTVTLAWTASDPDNDSLRFTFVYKHVNDPDFQLLPLDLVSSVIPSTTAQSGVNTAPFAGNYSVLIDTRQLGGGGVIFRVIASDGIQSAQADSTAVTLPYKPPQPMILIPANNSHVPQGETVNFSGLAEDFQDGGVTGDGLIWRNQTGAILGVGALLSLNNLPVGSHPITLTAIDSVQLQASTTITIYVDADLPTVTPTSTTTPTVTPTRIPTATPTQPSTTQQMFLPVVER